MDLETRIRRRQRREDSSRLVREYGLLAPVTHVPEPTGRDPTIERLLGHLDPVFDGELPENGYVFGPSGSGKSAVVTAVFDRLARLDARQRQPIHTSTRAQQTPLPASTYVDARRADSEFAIYRRLLNSLIDESVPRQGIGTARLRERLTDRLANCSPGLVVAVDHLDEPDTPALCDLDAVLSPLPSNVRWLAVGRTPPGDTDAPTRDVHTVEVEPYSRQKLVDVLVARAADGLWPPGLDHEHARRVADWAGGDAHDALAATFVAADRAERADSSSVGRTHVEAAIESYPEPSVSLGRVLALPANQQAVLRELVDLDSADRASVTAATEAVGATDVDLSEGTIKRFLYELAERGVLARLERTPRDRKGRPPSRIEVRFPAAVFSRLSEA